MLPYGWIGPLLKLSLVARVIRWAAGGLLGLAVLGWIVDRAGPSTSEVVVHVTEPDVEVSIDDRTYEIEGSRKAPIVCDLTPGQHHLVMSRAERVLFEETFDVRAGANVVRTAWAPRRPRGAALAR